MLKETFQKIPISIEIKRITARHFLFLLYYSDQFTCYLFFKKHTTKAYKIFAFKIKKKILYLKVNFLEPVHVKKNRQFWKKLKFLFLQSTHKI